MRTDDGRDVVVRIKLERDEIIEEVSTF